MKDFDRGTFDIERDVDRRGNYTNIYGDLIGCRRFLDLDFGLSVVVFIVRLSS